jgi:hypothetical protein
MQGDLPLFLPILAPFFAIRTLSRMDSRDLEPWQADNVRRQLLPSLKYLGAMQRRMERRGFKPDDRLYVQTREAYEALHRLCTELHYLTCGDKTGR